MDAEAMTTSRIYKVGVYHTVDNGREHWTGYTTWLNPEWSGFVGYFDVVADSHKRAVAAAVREAKRNRVQRQIAEGQRGSEES